MKKIGDLLSICILLLIAISFIVVLMSFLFNITYIPAQEFITYLHSIVFMLGIVYAYHHEKHVRIDIFYQNHSKGKQAKINKIGTILLLIPLFVFMFYASFDYVMSSWSKFEGSNEAGGIPFVYGLKTLILLLPVSMVFYSVFRLWRKS